MKAVNSNWFECVIKYDSTNELGKQVKVTETDVVEALSFSEAETLFVEHVTPYISGSYEVKKINPLPVHEVFFSENESDDRWFKCKLTFIMFDENTNKEQRTTVSYLVQADSLKTALKYIEQEMNNSTIDYLASEISETKILDIFRKQNNE